MFSFYNLGKTSSYSLSCLQNEASLSTNSNYSYSGMLCYVNLCYFFFFNYALNSNFPCGICLFRVLVLNLISPPPPPSFFTNGMNFDVNSYAVLLLSLENYDLEYFLMREVQCIFVLRTH
ncbi:unnamed protein product [Citrullus colocynthis]|uniref:Uncharacterized protein n=1 Tax=Citrullus colocynthis TaxID=252529 RepID=A0ABP0YFN2_9ROSI